MVYTNTKASNKSEMTMVLNLIVLVADRPRNHGLTSPVTKSDWTWRPPSNPSRSHGLILAKAVDRARGPGESLGPQGLTKLWFVNLDSSDLTIAWFVQFLDRSLHECRQSSQFTATRSFCCWRQAILKSTPTKAKRKELALLPDNYGSMASMPRMALKTRGSGNHSH